MYSQNRPSKIPRAGFTLLELIGVMTVIAILAAAVLPGAIELIRTQRAVKEGAVLPKIAEALKRGMLREQVFPIYENDADKLTEDNGRRSETRSQGWQRYGGRKAQVGARHGQQGNPWQRLQQS